MPNFCSCCSLSLQNYWKQWRVNQTSVDATQQQWKLGKKRHIPTSQKCTHAIGNDWVTKRSFKIKKPELITFYNHKRWKSTIQRTLHKLPAWISTDYIKVIVLSSSSKWTVQCTCIIHKTWFYVHFLCDITCAIVIL